MEFDWFDVKAHILKCICFLCIYWANDTPQLEFEPQNGPMGQK